MSYVTQSLPLQFWTRLQARMNDDYLAGITAVRAGRNMTVPASIDDAQLKTELAETLRNTALLKLRRLEDLAVLRMVVGNQVLYASMEQQLPTLNSRIEYYQSVIYLFESTMVGLPSRQAMQDALADAQKQYNELRGGSEHVQASRVRLSAFRAELRVLGSEDAGGHETAIRNLKAMVDQLETERDGLLATTTIALTIPDDLAPLLSEFGVMVQLIAETPQEEAPQGQPTKVDEPGEVVADVAVMSTPGTGPDASE